MSDWGEYLSPAFSRLLLFLCLWTCMLVSTRVLYGLICLLPRYRSICDDIPYCVGPSLLIIGLGYF